MQANDRTTENVMDALTAEITHVRDSRCAGAPEDLRRALATPSPMQDPPGVRRAYVILTCHS